MPRPTTFTNAERIFMINDFEVRAAVQRGAAKKIRNRIMPNDSPADKGRATKTANRMDAMAATYERAAAAHKAAL